MTPDLTTMPFKSLRRRHEQVANALADMARDERMRGSDTMARLAAKERIYRRERVRRAWERDGPTGGNA